MLVCELDVRVRELEIKVGLRGRRGGERVPFLSSIIDLGVEGVRTAYLSSFSYSYDGERASNYIYIPSIQIYRRPFISLHYIRSHRDLSPVHAMSSLSSRVIGERQQRHRTRNGLINSEWTPHMWYRQSIELCHAGLHGKR